ncbi:MAG: hypothetical protein QOH61_2063 [Chloroflexota bacterium]|jgi:DNA-binding MarR family transcriptional regulator|nr:hypothetical protein [Chloroflexota bacterium]
MPTSAAIRLWQAIGAAHAALSEQLDPEGAGCEVVGSDTVAILLPLSEAPEQQLRMGELAERSHLTPSGLTRRVDRLEKAGLVARTECPADRRGAYTRLTPQGLDELQRALPHHASTLEEFVGPRLGDDAATRLAELLEELAATPPGR